MEALFAYFQQRIALDDADRSLLEELFIPQELPAKSVFIAEGQPGRYLYFLVEGIVRGYKNQEGKLVVEHLVAPPNFIASMESFFQGAPATDCFETLTDSTLYKISKAGLDRMKSTDAKWSGLVEAVTNESLRCKMERVHDFQTLTAKERYLKFVRDSPYLALNVSVENIASFLGIEPQSLSRIRRQVAI